MSLPRVHKNTQLAWADLAIFAGVIAFLAYSVHVFFFNTKPAPAKLEQATIGAPPPVEAAPARAPASHINSKTEGSTEVLRLSCLHNTLRNFSSNARLMQIHAPFCPDDAHQKGIWHAKNETSGEEIMVFVNRKEKTVSTNYFNLKNGLNKIVFLQDLGKGQIREEKFEVKSDQKAD